MNALPAILLFFLGLIPALAQRDAPSSPPPMAESTSVTVFRGQSVDIPLKASGRIPGPLKFLIRTQPTQGILGTIRPVGKNTAVVTYTQNPESKGSSDTFRFGVQAQDSPVSAPATITIEIQEEPARLELNAGYEFGDVAIGREIVKDIVVRNLGGQPAVVAPTVEKPWRLLDRSPKSVPPKSQQTWKIAFAPVAEGDFTGEFRIVEPLTRPAKLEGRGYEGLRIFPGTPITLKASNGREAVLKIQNPTGTGVTVSLVPPTGVLVPESLKLAPGETREVPLKASPTQVVASAGTLTISAGDLKKDVQVSLEALPAELVVNPANGLDFSAAAGTSSASLELQNRGGQAARLDCKLPAGFVIVPQPAMTVIPPGETRKFEVTFEASVPSAREALTLQFSTPGGATVSVPLRVAGAVPPVLTKPSEPQTPGISAPQPPPAIPPPVAPAQPLLGELRIIEQTPGTVRVLWERAPEKAATYDVEYRTLEPVDENSPPRTRWIRLRDVKATPAASGISLEISRLPWNSSWFVRGIAKDKSGQVLGTSDVARIASPSNPSRLGVLWVIPALLAAGIAAGVLFQRKRDQSAAEERARIERLEGDGGKSG